MEVLKFVLLMIALGLFAAVVLSTLVVVLVVAIGGWLTAFVPSLLRRKGSARERAAKVRRLAGQEGT
jgi:hypothetical protein